MGIVPAPVIIARGAEFDDSALTLGFFVVVGGLISAACIVVCVVVACDVVDCAVVFFAVVASVVAACVVAACVVVTAFATATLGSSASCATMGPSIASE